MKLRDLEATFVKIVDAKTYQTEGVAIADAQGVMFLCPKCFAANGGNVGTHMVLCWFKDRGVPDDTDPKPGRWNPQGDSIDTLTFVGSVLLTSGCNWHGFVKDGDAT